ncbi:hypothetical protein H257_15994 [Aphanomyces astaci]|uniref:Uncharacterized protein n=1 Tax=Aphanomyces astaci TaxID=112090 RepID=W4FK53_APHAT|nr:hypothetical protein H257_15994 [Aphanomyces astaci]ETV67870.1 hypothetical protein H257_15994 [Aphanomyces astaci]|eukprot:XP_009842615.1 hypothetical protein H257_15994 [Aphanomyces astaci]
MASKRHSRFATIGGQGHKQLIPFGPALLEFMRSRQGDEHYVRVFHMMTWVKKNHHAWLVEYLSTKKNEVSGSSPSGACSFASQNAIAFTTERHAPSS